MLEHKRVLLGDEMGLGKAIQILGLINADHSIRSALIVVPGGLRDNWLRESKKWLIRKPRLISAQDLPLNPDEHSIHRYLRVPQGGEDMPETLVVASYDDIVVKPWILEPNPCVGQPVWGLFAVDEAHLLKALSSVRAKTIFGERPWSQGMASQASTYCVLATGTPLTNRPLGLYRLIVNLQLGWMWYDTFRQRYCGPRTIKLPDGRTMTRCDGATHLSELERKLRSSVLLRRLKRDVLTELPAIERITISVPANQQASEAYDSYLAAIEALKLANYGSETFGSMLPVLPQLPELKLGYLIGELDAALLREIDNLNEDEAELSDSSRDALIALKEIRSEVPPHSTTPLGQCLRTLSQARQSAGQAKLPAIVDHVRTLVASGEKGCRCRASSGLFATSLTGISRPRSDNRRLQNAK